MNYNPTEVAERPWGAWKVVHQEEGVHAGEFSKTVKVLTVNPGCMLSLQSHQHRTEYWQPLESGLVAYISDPESAAGPRVELLQPTKVYQIRQGSIHRLVNPGAKVISVIETIVGDYDEEDIIRYHDAYGRK